jgi:glycosyltransferase involved in cell wall biosynthesis
MLTQFFNPVLGGEERMVEVLGKELVARGHHVAVATLLQEGLPRDELIAGLHVHRIRSVTGRAGWLYAETQRRHLPPTPDPQVVAGLRAVFAAEQPDVVHAHNWIVYSYLPLRKRRRAPLVLSLHDYGLVCATKRLMYQERPCLGPGPVKCFRCAATHYSPLKGTMTVLLHRSSGPFLSRAVDRYLPVSSAVARATGLEHSGLPFEVIPNFVVTDVEPVESARDRSVLSQLPPGDFVLFVGDVSTEKGVEVLLEAHADLRPRPPLVLLGRDVIHGVRATDGNVLFLGPVSHGAAVQAMRRSAVVVAPSVWLDPFPLVALEAASVGRPVIAARSGGIPEMVAHEQTGLLVPPGDRSALAAAMQRLLGDPELRARMGEAGATRISSSFSPNAVVPRFEGTYGSLLGMRAQDG